MPGSWPAESGLPQFGLVVRLHRFLHIGKNPQELGKAIAQLRKNAVRSIKKSLTGKLDSGWSMGELFFT
jgi:hypothetical protein